MLLSTINQMDESLNKLDLLDDMWVRNSDMEKQFKKLDSNISDIRNDLNQQAQVINNEH
jgi:DNA-binding winged helix-turn-helix (wHTH) protein